MINKSWDAINVEPAQNCTFMRHKAHTGTAVHICMHEFCRRATSRACVRLAIQIAVDPCIGLQSNLCSTEYKVYSIINL